MSSSNTRKPQSASIGYTDGEAVSSFSQLNLEDPRILKRWRIWEPIILICFSGRIHGPECERQVCPCNKKHIDVRSVRQSHGECVRRMLDGGISLGVMDKYNLDSPMVGEIVRNEWIEVFLDRTKVQKTKEKRNASKS
jgi:hypothetical protein